MSRDRAPGVVECYGHRRQELLHPPGQIRITRSGILHLIKLSGKTAEVMDRPGSRADGDAGSWHKPMRGYRQDGLGSGDLDPDATPAFGVGVAPHGIHGIAMSEEDGRPKLSHKNVPFRGE